MNRKWLGCKDPRPIFSDPLPTASLPKDFTISLNISGGPAAQTHELMRNSSHSKYRKKSKRRVLDFSSFKNTFWSVMSFHWPYYILTWKCLHPPLPLASKSKLRLRKHVWGYLPWISDSSTSYPCSDSISLLAKSSKTARLHNTWHRGEKSGTLETMLGLPASAGGLGQSHFVSGEIFSSIR